MISVMVVDDSAVIRQALVEVLDKCSDMKVTSTARDPVRAIEMLEASSRWPDLFVLDLEMPRMDGLTFLKWVMQKRPTPVVVCSTKTTAGSAEAIEALTLGAVDVVGKPTVGAKEFFDDENGHFVDLLRAASVARLDANPRAKDGPNSGKNSAGTTAPKSQIKPGSFSCIAIGSSTGGPRVLEYILPQLRPTSPGVVVVQHMSKAFTGTLAKVLDEQCAVSVREARDGDFVAPGTVLIAPGGTHMMVKDCGKAGVCVELRDGPPVNRHKPSVDVLFRSVAKVAGASAMGVLLTGMGNDGAAGLLAMRKAGANTVAQNAASCTIYGMPKAAMENGAASLQGSPDEIVSWLTKLKAAS